MDFSVAKFEHCVCRREMRRASLTSSWVGEEWSTTTMQWSAVDLQERTWQERPNPTGISPCSGETCFYVANSSLPAVLCTHIMNITCYMPCPINMIEGRCHVLYYTLSYDSFTIWKALGLDKKSYCKRIYDKVYVTYCQCQVLKVCLWKWCKVRNRTGNFAEVGVIY
jgi:hypothetical protein